MRNVKCAKDKWSNVKRQVSVGAQSDHFRWENRYNVAVASLEL